MRNKRFWLRLALGACGVLVVLVGPVVWRQLRPQPRRSLVGVKLAEVNYREIAFRNDSQAIDLTGMLLVPDGDGPFPAVVVIHGSGTSRRDNAWYLTLGKHLQQHGIVVLLPDKRGSERSQGNWRSASFQDLADDTLAAIGWLQTQRDVPVSRIGLVGMSQGGVIAPLVACQSRDVVFVVSVVGGARPIHTELMYEEDHNLRQLGIVPGISRLVAWLSTSYLVHVGQREFWSHVGNFDPLPHWQQLEIPALALYGELDTNLDAHANAARIKSLGKSNVEVVVYAGSGHALEDPPGSGESIFREDALRRITDFIHSAVLGGATTGL